MVNKVETHAVDVDIRADGNTVVAQDVYPGGDRSVLKQQLGTHRTPGHAHVFAQILNDPRLFILMAAGDITQEHIDKAAEAFNANGQPS